MLEFEFLPGGRKYKLTLIADGKQDKDSSTQYIVTDKNSPVYVRLMHRGFVISLILI